MKNADNRKHEIVASIKSFSKERYHKSELLPEMMQLQQELVDLTFNDIHAENSGLRIWDVFNHLNALNTERGHIADKQLELFNADCKIISNTISGEISGNKGEEKAYRSLCEANCPKWVLRNVELIENNYRTELDIVVITSKAVFLIEVKNPCKDIYIDEKGNYCRGENRVFDKNIGEKMNDKEYLLRAALKSAGTENPNIVNLLVFTNSTITVKSEYPYIDVCYLSSLPHKIDNYAGPEIYNEENIQQMSQAVEASRGHESYTLPFNTEALKENFADLMTLLEIPLAEDHETESTLQADKGISNNNEKDFADRNKIGAVLATASVIALAAAGIFWKVKR